LVSLAVLVRPLLLLLLSLPLLLEDLKCGVSWWPPQSPSLRRLTSLTLPVLPSVLPLPLPPPLSQSLSTLMLFWLLWLSKAARKEENDSGGGPDTVACRPHTVADRGR
jgi:O-antigen ligase